ncbi:MAG: outer membrane lipoprotein chaperone LolA [Bryobacteraceae bacterium]|nr:outer membrane lipoprotein chaperone LolA [Bryobacteraceae bacterium]
MRSFLLAVCLTASAAAAAPIEVSRILNRVENRYNSPKTMQLRFQQTYTGLGSPARVESGDLFLSKPRKMRWEYRDPEGKLFVSDGRFVYFYSPNSNRVEKMTLKESGDMRVPLAFLIGRLDFQRDFREFRARRDGDDVNIVALPKSDRSPFEKVEFVVTPQYRIKRVVITSQDQSVMDFQFSEEKLNAPLQAKTFEFQAPPGAEFVEITGDEDEAY